MSLVGPRPVRSIGGNAHDGVVQEVPLQTIGSHRRGVAATAAADADRVAVIDGDRHLTFAELDQRANGLARRLAELGVAPAKRSACACTTGPSGSSCPMPSPDWVPCSFPSPRASLPPRLPTSPSIRR